MSSKEDSVYRRCLACGWVHEGVLSDGKNDLKYSHCCNCFEDYTNFQEATEEDLLHHHTKKRIIGKILIY